MSSDFKGRVKILGSQRCGEVEVVDGCVKALNDAGPQNLPCSGEAKISDGRSPLGEAKVSNGRLHVRVCN